MPRAEPSVPGSLAQLEATLLAMHAARAGFGAQPGQWNRLVNRAQRIHLTLRTSPEGREGITALISHACETPRLWAATWALAWDEHLARAELERQATGDGLDALDARMTLKEFDAGRLDTTWQPTSR